MLFFDFLPLNDYIARLENISRIVIWNVNSSFATLDFNIFIGEQGVGKLTVTTHSPYLLSTLNNMIEADNVSKLHPENVHEK